MNVQLVKMMLVAYREPGVMDIIKYVCLILQPVPEIPLITQE